METDENFTALKRNCTNLVYKTTKDATSRIMILEERALLFQRELQLANEDSFGMQRKLQEMIESKMTTSHGGGLTSSSSLAKKKVGTENGGAHPDSAHRKSITASRKVGLPGERTVKR